MTRFLTVCAGLILTATGAMAAGQGNGNSGMPPGVAAHFIENWDLDGDGSVTLEEAREKRGELFYMFDSDENGQLDSAEYDLFDETRLADMKEQGMGKGGPKKGSGAAMLAREFSDADNNGEVSQQEFLDATDTWFARMDRNADGLLTMDDFGKAKP